MSLPAYQPDRVFRPRPQPNQVDEWCTETFDYGYGRRMSCRLTLGCGHQIPLATRYDARPGAEGAGHREAKAKLDRAITQHVDTHDCAAYTRQRALAQVTARLKE